MSITAIRTEPADVPGSALALMLVMTFAIAWGCLGLFLLWPEAMTRLTGPISSHHSLFIVAVYAPAIAAVVTVLRHTGAIGFKRFLSRLLLWRCSKSCVAFLIFGIPLIYVFGAFMKGTLAAPVGPLPSIGATLGAMAFMLVLGPMEEIGWRGVVLPLLQRRSTPLGAALGLGMLWGVWHMPAFFLSGTPQSSWSFLPFFIGAVAISVILTPLFNASGGSILLAALFHFQLNNPLWPDAQPHDTIGFAAAALIVTALNWRAMTTQDGAITFVVPSDRIWQPDHQNNAAAQRLDA